MSRIESGMLCTIVGGVFSVVHGAQSANMGKRVVAVKLMGEHSQFGRVWRCTAAPGTTLVTEYGVSGLSCDFAEDWLEPVKPPPLPAWAALKKLAA